MRVTRSTQTCTHFRRTYATLFSGTTKIQTIQYLLGHKDIKTTMRYLGIPDLNSPETRTAVEKRLSESSNRTDCYCPNQDSRSDVEILLKRQYQKGSESTNNIYTLCLQIQYLIG